MTLQQSDFCTVVETFLDDRESNLSCHRYTAFDYCYNYFHPDNFNPGKHDMEKSCLVLFSFLANWGMLRNSFLMRENYKRLEETVRYIAESDPSLWKIDVDSYTDSNIERIVATYKNVEKLLVREDSKSLTIVTKLLLGVYGFVPEFDDRFGKTFREIPFKKILGEHCGFRSCRPFAYQCIKVFYEANKGEIDNFHKKIKTIDFRTGKNMNLHYPKAKIIDMYGFQKGGS